MTTNSNQSGHSITVERGVPIPPKQVRFTAKYPWYTMQVGDSFFIPDRADGTPPAAGSPNPKLGMKITTRRVPGGIRIWRTE